MCGYFLKKRRAQRLGVYLCFLKKKKGLYKTEHNETQQKQKMNQSPSKKWPYKGHDVPTARGLLWFREKQCREKDVPSGKTAWPNSAFWWKTSSKRCFLMKIMKIENGTKITLFMKVQHLDPLKTFPGSGFEKTWKIDENIIGKPMVFLWSRNIGKYWKTNNFCWF